MRVLMWEHFAPGGPIRVGGHHFAERFLRSGARVAWCAGPISPINLVKRNPEIDRRLALWRRGGARMADGSMFAYAPMTLLPYRPYPLFDSEVVYRNTLAATIPGWRGVLAAAGFDRVDLLWMSPGAPSLPLLDSLPHHRSVYRMSDDTAQFPDTPKSFGRLEAAVCRRVDLVVATSRALLERARACNARRVFFLPNACEAERFISPAGHRPDELAGLKRPRAIYAGAIDSWFDVELLIEIADRMQDWDFVLLGPSRTDLSRLERRANVRCLGPRAYDDLPSYLQAADAGIVPFRLTPMTHAIHPIKVYEYCAAGLPVVVTPMQETVAMRAPVRIAADAGEFERALRQGYPSDAGAKQAAIAFARANTWDHRFASVQSELARLDEPAPVAAAGAAH